jgi:DNA-binding IclR family transcriptional regulator
MHIDAYAVLVGQPILQIRKVLRRARDAGHCTQQLVEEMLDVDRATAAAVLRSLIEDGYLERDDDSDGAGWRTTMRANALAQASAAAPLTRNHSCSRRGCIDSPSAAGQR